MWAEIDYARAWMSSGTPREALARFASARAIFPLSSDFRRGQAVFLSQTRWIGSRSLAIAALRRALIDDPYAADMRRNLGAFLYEDNQFEAAQREFATLRARVPMGNINVLVNTNPATGGNPNLSGALR
jgi:Tfp pilus assembly protein PilF